MSYQIIFVVSPYGVKNKHKFTNILKNYLHMTDDCEIIIHQSAARGWNRISLKEDGLIGCVNEKARICRYLNRIGVKSLMILVGPLSNEDYEKIKPYSEGIYLLNLDKNISHPVPPDFVLNLDVGEDVFDYKADVYVPKIPSPQSTGAGYVSSSPKWAAFPLSTGAGYVSSSPKFTATNILSAPAYEPTAHAYFPSIATSQDVFGWNKIGDKDLGKRCMEVPVLERAPKRRKRVDREEEINGNYLWTCNLREGIMNFYEMHYVKDDDGGWITPTCNFIKVFGRNIYVPIGTKFCSMETTEKDKYYTISKIFIDRKALFHYNKDRKIIYYYN